MVPVGQAKRRLTRATRQALPKPTLTQLVAQANQLSNEITSLGQQYDGPRPPAQARPSRGQARAGGRGPDARQLASSQHAVAQLAAGSYMNNGLDPTRADVRRRRPRLVPQPGIHRHELNNQAGMRLTACARRRSPPSGHS